MFRIDLTTPLDRPRTLTSWAGVALGLFFLGLPLVAAQAEPPGLHPKQSYVVGFAQDTLANDWRTAQVNQLMSALIPHKGIRFVYSDAQGQTAKQVMDIEDFVQQKVDVLVTSPRDARMLAPAVSQAYKKGIPVVLLSRSIESDDYTILIAPDNYAIGQQAGRYIRQVKSGKANILMLRGVETSSTAIARTQGFEDEIKHHPEMKIVADRAANYLRADAIRAVDTVLQEGIKFDAIYAQSDSMASGARVALKHAGIDPKTIIIVGIDYIREAKEAIRSGEQAASFTYPTGGKHGGEYILKILKGEKVPKKVVIDSLMVTKDNVDEVEPIF